jgi:hypothetical protein
MHGSCSGGDVMTPLKFDGFNRVYKKNELQPDDIPAMRVGSKVTSRWWPTQGEIEQLKAGGAIELTIHGGQPAVALRVV